MLLRGFSAQAADVSNVLIVDLYLNEQHMGDTFVLKDDDSNFFVAEDILLRWQITKPWPEAQIFRGDRYYGIHQFAGAGADFNLRAMELHVSMPPALMPTRTVDMTDNGLAARASEFGAYMDYEINFLRHESSGEQTTFGLFRPVLFGGFGNISANAIYRHDSGDNIASEELSGRGMTVLELTYTRDDPSRLRSFRAGDIFATAGSQGRALRMGGIQLATDFSTQPTLITHPLPNFYGQTAVPSALDLYVNGRLTRREQVQPGSYILEGVPVVNGAGQLQVVATDALGRQQIFTQDFYLATELLKQGLSDYSLSIGALREDYGLENFRYGKMAASATWRYGLRENLTVEGHGEFTNNLAMLGGVAQYAIKSGGTLSTGLGLSTGDPGTGTRWELGFRQLTDFFNYNLEIAGSSQDFAQVGNLEPAPRFQGLATAGKSFHNYGSLGASVVLQRFHNKPSRTIMSLNHSKTFRNRLSLSAFLSYLDAASDDLTVGIRFSLPFGDFYSTNGGMSVGGSAGAIDADIRRDMPYGTGYGYHIGISAAGNNFIDAGIIAQNDYGSYSLDVRDSDATGSVWQFGSSGSIAYLAGMTNMTRQVRDAFAVVSVGNFEGVRVYSENLEIGRTNKNGQLFVPGLRPYLKNQLRIEIDDLPLSAKIANTSAITAPYYRSGVVVNFDVHASNNVIFRAILPDGAPVPEGATASVQYADDIFPVGTDGRVYLQGIDRSSQVRIRWADTVCEVDIPPLSGDAIIERLGEIECRPSKVQ